MSRYDLRRMIRVSIVEDDDRIAESLRNLLAESPDFVCSGLHRTAEEAVKNISGERPDCVLMDINLPGMSGIEAVGQVRQLLPTAAILMLTVYEDSERVFRALKLGAHGYLLKRTAPDKLLECIREAIDGGAPMSPQIARKVVQHFHLAAPGGGAFSVLTPREQQILALLAKGGLYKEIAAQLDISVETVRSHLQSIYGKLHVRTRTEAVVKYLGQRPD